MKFIYDYFPIICFFVAYKLYGIYNATAVTMAASVLQIGIFWLVYRRFERLHLIMLAFILVLGGMTLILHDDIYIKWKPSVIYWIMGLLLIASHFFGKKPIIHRLLDGKLTLPKKIWSRVNFSWGIFFFLLGWINLYVVYHFSTNAWVNFKLFGALGLTLVFALVQVLFLSKHIEKEDKKES